MKIWAGLVVQRDGLLVKTGSLLLKTKEARRGKGKAVLWRFSGNKIKAPMASPASSQLSCPTSALTLEIPPVEQSAVPSLCYCSLSWLSQLKWLCHYGINKFCLPTPQARMGKAFCFCSLGMEIQFLMCCDHAVSWLNFKTRLGAQRQEGNFSPLWKHFQINKCMYIHMCIYSFL